jgi:hypothetical protein
VRDGQGGVPPFSIRGEVGRLSLHRHRRHARDESSTRRGWNVTSKIPEVLSELPSGVYYGELVAFRNSVPHFPDL